MDYRQLSETLFSHIHHTVEDYEEKFPQRNLPEGARVTRLAPSPTGFIHLGNLYGALVDERLAHQSDGTFILRIEDTDHKRKVEGSEELIISSLDYFGLIFDEGALLQGDVGDYGPYYQSQREIIYQTVCKQLVAMGKAYPCFCTEEELADIRRRQEEAKENTGYYGKWARDREMSYEEIRERMDRGESYVLRFKSQGREGETFEIQDAIRGSILNQKNYQDTVLLKSNGIPTYHFAHVVDDHFMRITHVVRGEEWLSTLPIHYELFTALGWPLPMYCHTAHLMKMDEGNKRKLSKRKDPELGLSYYMGLGYFPEAMKEYLMTLLNSDFEEWRMAHPDLPMEDFEFTLEKMGKSGALFDIQKLADISKETLLKMPAEKIFDFLWNWAKKYKEEAAPLLEQNREEVIQLLDVGRKDKKPRKDLIFAEQIFEFIRYYFDELFVVEDPLPENFSLEEAKYILSEYLKTYDPGDDQETWFEKIRSIATSNGYAANMKDYKKNPEQFKGNVAHISTVIRLAVVGRSSSPDVWTLQQIMKEEKIKKRIKEFKI